MTTRASGPWPSGRAPRRSGFPAFATLGAALLWLTGDAALGAEAVQTAADLTTMSAAELDQLGLEELLELKVSSATKTEQTVSEAPAVITVITRDELEARGLGSVAEALRTVPGFYDVFDLVTHNVGVRGVNGGARASGSVIKVLIDGSAISYRPSTGNFFGPELIPIEAVERIEVIRGPASALYGANAFLGVVNVITRTGASAGGARVTARAGAQRGLGYGGGLLVGASAGSGIDLLVAVDSQLEDRSGLALPASSPRYERLKARGRSARDFSQPSSLFGKLSFGDATAGPGIFQVATSLQGVDAAGEFHNGVPLTHRTRVGLANQSHRLAWSRELGRFTLSVSGGIFDSAPSAVDRLSLADPSFELVRSARTSGFAAAAEALWRPSVPLTLSLALDAQREDHLLQSYSTRLLQHVRGLDGMILRPSGSTIPGDGAGARRRFELVGASAQVLWNAPLGIGLTGGVRAELHSVYAAQISPRLAAVWAPADRPYTLKLLLGSSFKAPSAEQLHTRPAQPDDLVGNPRLQAQRASTAEVAWTLRLGHRAELAINAFATALSGRVEFVQRGLFLEARNAADEWFAGGEFDGRFSLHPKLQLRAGASVSALLDRARAPAVFVLGEVPSQPLFPWLQAHLVADWHLPWAGLRVLPEISFVAPREASQSNTLEAGRLYQLPSYVLTALTLSMPERRLLRDRPTRFALRVHDVLGTARADPGFNGVDVPPLGRTVLLTVVQGL